MKKLFLALFAFIAPVVALTAGISGTYSVEGFDPNAGQPYTGVVVITRDGDVYNSVWTFNDGSQEEGTGLKVGCQLSFVFEGITTDNAPGQLPQEPCNADTGVQVYKFKDDKLSGPWVLLDSSNVGHETITKVDN